MKSSKTHKGKQCLNRLKKGGKALAGTATCVLCAMVTRGAAVASSRSLMMPMCLAGIFAAAHGMRGVHSSPHCLQCR